jgi:hypothetical protein
LGDESLAALLDAETVTCLETLTPQASFDASLISRMMDDGMIFPAIHEAATRESIKERLLSVHGRITSFTTFVDDSKCMEAWVKSLRPLLPSVPESFRTAMLAQFQPSHHIIQTSSGYRAFQGTASSYNIFGYLMLFLAAMRDFPFLGRMYPRQDRGGKKPVIEGCREEYQARMAQLAIDLGCVGDRLQESVKNDPDCLAARAFVDQSRPGQLWDIDETRASALVNHIVHELRVLATRRSHEIRPEYISEFAPVEKRFRSGLPNERAYKETREYLYIDTIINYTQPQGVNLTALAFQIEIFLSFFEVPTSRDSAEPQGLISSHGSSNYETATLYSSQPVSHIPDYRLSEEGPYSTGYDQYAAGFEEGAASPFYECLTLRSSERLSVVIHDFLLNPRGIFVLYIWSNCSFAKFMDTPESKVAFNDLAANLADDGLGFISVESNNVTTLALPDLWEEIQETRILFAGPKSTTHFTISTQYDEFLEYMEGFRARL